MEKYYFIYSVESISQKGELNLDSMILDHEELSDVITDARNSHARITRVYVNMHDSNGNDANERDITSMFFGAN